MHEDVSFFLAPSAAKAFSYGERHFNGSDMAGYDIDRAMYFFMEAEQLDPTLLHVHHELARMYFIHGDFEDAMAQIDVQIAEHGDSTPSSYYVRGLIEGYMGDYTDAATDYAHFLQFDPRDWAALNDYAWVLLKADRPEDAARITARGLADFPDNPWLLNSRATALYELGDYAAALEAAQKASALVIDLTQMQWLKAYPGNDPRIASQGIAAFTLAVDDNMHTIGQALASSTVQ
jgi:tetratricopeptide (TPR) repeat protein